MDPFNEASILRTFSINNWTELTRELATKLAQMIPAIHPELAASVISKLAPDLAKHVRDLGEAAIAADDRNQGRLHDLYGKESDFLLEALKSAESREERSEVRAEHRMLRESADAKDSENKRHHITVLTIVASAAALILIAVTSAGRNTSSTSVA